MKKTLLIFSLLVMVTACSQKAKEELGIEKQIPNEKVITTNNPLTLPPDFDKTPVSEKVGSEFNS